MQFRLMAFDHVQLAIPEGQEERAEAFYSGVLGLSRVPKPDELAGRGGCWFRGRSVEVHLGVEPDFRPAGKAHPAFLVNDLEAVRVRLSEAGATIRDDVPLSGRRRFHSHDPFGNRLEFIAADASEREMRLLIRRFDASVPLPSYARPGDAGLDLRANVEVQLAPGERAMVPTGIATAIPVGYAGLVLPRSGLASQHGIALANAPGLIDSGYRGEVTVALVNLDRESGYRVERGERIAQLVLVPAPEVRLVEVEELPPSDRGAGGFGSTGR